MEKTDAAGAMVVSGRGGWGCPSAQLWAPPSWTRLGTMLCIIQNEGRSQDKISEQVSTWECRAV